MITLSCPVSRETVMKSSLSGFLMTYLEASGDVLREQLLSEGANPDDYVLAAVEITLDPFMKQFTINYKLLNKTSL